MHLIFLTSKMELGSCWATVAMFVVGKPWLFSQGISQLKHRDLHIIWAPQVGAAGCGAV